MFIASTGYSNTDQHKLLNAHLFDHNTNTKRKSVEEYDIFKKKSAEYLTNMSTKSKSFDFSDQMIKNKKKNKDSNFWLDHAIKKNQTLLRTTINMGLSQQREKYLDAKEYLNRHFDEST